MQDRYEIRGKLGQGGLGSVYKAWDHSLNREVAIKRIITEAEDEAHKDEATRQMTQETGALAALQHPHIVTISDVGTDEDGPFVVMELLKGETLDEIVERAPLTWKDFRELVLQVQEGMIAAQDLQIIHRDLKPSNIMVNWLPSGKFQVKIVDFGLARFSQQADLQALDQGDSIYGSVFFMAPEQFERRPVTSRTDMYALGCVYYFVLAGVMPYQGETAAQVMAAHLEHRVVPLVELRPDIPKWATDWVMWHLNRQPDERPENAREALENFIQLDIPGTESLANTPPPPAPTGPPRPKLIIPGAVPPPEPPKPAPRPAPPATQAVPQPLQPPSGAPPSIHTTALHSVSEPEVAPDAPPPAEAVVLREAAPVSVSEPLPSPSPPPSPTAASPPSNVQIGLGMATRKKGLSQGAKVAIIVLLSLVVLILGAVLLSTGKGNSETRRYNLLVEQAADANTRELPVSAEDVDILLNSIGAGSNRDRETVYKALAIAKAADGTDIDGKIVAFATRDLLDDTIRADLLGRVLRKRGNPSIVGPLLKFARETGSDKAASAALTAVSELGTQEDLPEFLDVIQFSSSIATRVAAENAAAHIIENSAIPDRHATTLSNALSTATSDDVRRAFIRLLGYAGGDRAKKLVTEALKGNDQGDTFAAIKAIEHWADDSMLPVLVEFLAVQTDDNLRAKSFDAALAYMKRPAPDRDAVDNEDLWKELADNAKLPREQGLLIGQLGSSEASDWALSIVNYFADESDDERVQDQAERAARQIQRRMKITEDDE